MPNFIDLSGKTFGRLLVMSKAPNRGSRTAWNCVCECGCSIVSTGNLLVSGHTKSCGCIRKEIAGARYRTHGFGYECKEYRSWNAARKRCLTKSNQAYKNYGALGVSMCSRWDSFDNFLKDMGPCPPGHTLDRINPFGNYEPTNCRWADSKTQRTNTRKNYRGKNE